ncbi:hypothetical protein THRCLA_01593 [Thraustotheca clavata]|uniref:Ankyrin repeat protein n=1 Tax=Thraustotheca clavata TaxID=74557 RepID=A0A1W0A7U6_9STRA|nr:hypothetical protein THRCLA_01593 [Thraustotheca clavata]
MLKILLMYANFDELQKGDNDYALGRALVCIGSLNDAYNTLDCMEILRKFTFLEIDLKSIVNSTPDMKLKEKKYLVCNGDCQNSKDLSLTTLVKTKSWTSVELHLRDSKLSDKGINELDENGLSILHYIFEHVKTRLYRLLSKREYLEFPLYVTTDSGHVDLVRALIDDGADPNMLLAPGPDDFGVKVNLECWWKESREEAENYINCSQSAMHVAVENELCIDVFHKPVDEDPYIVNVRNSMNLTPLMLAVHHGLLDHVKFLLENEAEVDAKDKAGRTTLIHAAMNQKTDIVKKLLNFIADIDVEDNVPKNYGGVFYCVN